MTALFRALVCGGCLAGLVLAFGCREPRRDDRLVGTWQAVELSGHPGRFGDELAKWRVTFGRDFSYAESAGCGPNNTRSGPQFACDETKPSKGTFKLGKIDGEFVDFVLPPAGDRLEVEIARDDPDKMTYMRWQTGDKVIMKRVAE